MPPQTGIAYDRVSAWLHKGGSRLVLLVEHGANPADALDNLAGLLRGLADEAETMARDIRWQERRATGGT